MALSCIQPLGFCIPDNIRTGINASCIMQMVLRFEACCSPCSSSEKVIPCPFYYINIFCVRLEEELIITFL